MLFRRMAQARGQLTQLGEGLGPAHSLLHACKLHTLLNACTVHTPLHACTVHTLLHACTVQSQQRTDLSSLHAEPAVGSICFTSQCKGHVQSWWILRTPSHWHQSKVGPSPCQ